MKEMADIYMLDKKGHLHKMMHADDLVISETMEELQVKFYS